MAPRFAGNSRKATFSTAGTRACLAALSFVFLILPAAFATGAGKSSVPCQGTTISATDDIVSIINNGKPNQTFCIQGEHRISSPIQVQSGQSLIGTTSDSRISGAVVLTPWQSTSTAGVYYYDGPYAQIQAHRQNQFFSGGANVCYSVSTYQDDLFFRSTPSDDQRIMRVLSQAEVDPTQGITTQGQAITAGEAGRFFFDYANHHIYVSLPNGADPNTVTVDLAHSLNAGSNESLIYGPGQANVTLQNLFVEKGLNYGLYGGNLWTLKEMTIRFIHNVGLYNIVGTATQPALIDDTLFTSIGRKVLNATTGVAITNSEMSWNNIANFRETDGLTGSGVCNGYSDAGTFHIYQFVGTQSQPAVIIDNLWSHDNIGDGLWSDGGTQYVQITNSTLSNNERYGYLHEISCQINFSGNTIYGNGRPLKNPDITGGGVNVSDSNYGAFTSNLIYGNEPGFAFHLTLQTPHPFMNANKCLGAKNIGDTSNSLKYNQVSGNAIYTCAGDASIGKVWGPGGSLNARGNQFQFNQYHLADSTSNWFADGNSANNYVPQDWGTWQQGKHDSQGTMAVGCTYTNVGSVHTTITVSLAPTAVNVKAIGPVVATAVVKPVTGSAIPTGTVIFFNGDIQIGSQSLNNGVAVFNYNPSALVAGQYSITATYLETSKFGASTSAPLTLTVQDFQIVANPSTVSVSAPGGSGTTTLTLTPLVGFNQQVTYSCSGLPAGATCTFTPTSSAAEKLTIQTTTGAGRLDKNVISHGRLLYAFLLPGIVGLLIPAANRKRSLHGARLVALIALLTISTLAMPGCAGLATGHTNDTTSNGNNSVTVTAATAGTNPLSHSVIVTLTVQ